MSKHSKNRRGTAQLHHGRFLLSEIERMWPDVQKCLDMQSRVTRLISLFSVR